MSQPLQHNKSEHFRMIIDLLEEVQRRATKLITTIEDKVY
jgi:hypothetical protein